MPVPCVQKCSYIPGVRGSAVMSSCSSEGLHSLYVLLSCLSDVSTFLTAYSGLPSRLLKTFAVAREQGVLPLWPPKRYIVSASTLEAASILTVLHQVMRHFQTGMRHLHQVISLFRCCLPVLQLLVSPCAGPPLGNCYVSSLNGMIFMPFRAIQAAIFADRAV